MPVYCTSSGSMACQFSVTGTTGTWLSGYTAASPYQLTTTGANIAIKAAPNGISDNQSDTFTLYIGATSSQVVFSTTNSPPSFSSSFTNITNAIPSTTYYSGTATIAGIAYGGTGEPVTCTSTTSCKVSVNGAGYTSIPSNIYGNQTLSVSDVAQSGYSTSSSPVVTTDVISINGTSATWTITNQYRPDNFSMTWSGTNQPILSGTGTLALSGYVTGTNTTTAPSYYSSVVSLVIRDASTYTPTCNFSGSANGATCYISVNGGAYTQTTASSAIGSGSTFQIYVTAPTSDSVTVYPYVSIASTTSNASTTAFSLTTGSSPVSFSFTDINPATVASYTSTSAYTGTSTNLGIYGIASTGSGETATCSSTTTKCRLKVASGAWSSGTTATVLGGQTLQVEDQVASYSTPSSTTSVTDTVTIGNVSTTFKVTAQETPSAFSLLWDSGNTNIISGAGSNTLVGRANTTYVTTSTNLLNYTASAAVPMPVYCTGTTGSTCTGVSTSGTTGTFNVSSLVATGNNVSIKYTAPNGDGVTGTATLYIGTSSITGYQSTQATVTTTTSPSTFSFNAVTASGTGATTVGTSVSTISGIATSAGSPAGETAQCSVNTGGSCKVSTNGTTFTTTTTAYGGSTLYVQDTSPSTYSTTGSVMSFTDTIQINNTTANFTINNPYRPENFSIAWDSTMNSSTAGFVATIGTALTAYTLDSTGNTPNFTSTDSVTIWDTSTYTASCSVSPVTAISGATCSVTPSVANGVGGVTGAANSVKLTVTPPIYDGSSVIANLTVGPTTSTNYLKVTTGTSPYAFPFTAVTGATVNSYTSSSAVIHGIAVSPNGSGETAKCSNVGGYCQLKAGASGAWSAVGATTTIYGNQTLYVQDQAGCAGPGS